MERTPALIEIHYALWGVLSIPFGLVGLVFIVPGLMPVPGVVLLALCGLFILYVVRLSQGSRRAWLAGLLAHGIFVVTAPLYIGPWPDLLAIPLAVASLYSLLVLLRYRALWSGAPAPAAA